MKSKLVSSVALFKNVAVASLLASAVSSGFAATQSFQVFANANSIAYATHDASPLDTGLAFNVGDALQITATGHWDGGCGGNVGPDGAYCFNYSNGINFSALVGRVGSGDYFKIGNSFNGTATTSGDLFLAFVDSDSANNTGSVMATVMTPAIPEPETYAMLIAGLGALAFTARRRASTRRLSLLGRRSDYLDSTLRASVAGADSWRLLGNGAGQQTRIDP